MERELHTSVCASLLGEHYTMDVKTVADLVVPFLLNMYDITPKGW